MRFTFKDITNTDMYDSARVLFVLGQYGIFNNIAIDAIRDRCKPTRRIEIKPELLDDFADEFTSDVISISNNLDLDNYIKTYKVTNINGLWFTSADYSFMTNKQKDWLNNYIKAPSDNGKVVIYCSEWKDYRFLLKSNIIKNSAFTHMIQLGFPNKTTLESVVRALFNKRGVNITDQAIELFIMRMSNSYDDYEEVIDKIIVESTNTKKDISIASSLNGVTNVFVNTANNSNQSNKVFSGTEVKPTNMIEANEKPIITYEKALESMKGIENFVIDDFVEKLIVPLSTDKITVKNKRYKMLHALLEEYGAIQLVNKLKTKIDDYIEFRLAINSGVIPIKVRFSVPEAKEMLGDGHRLSKISDYMFRRMAEIASKTSLNDWLYMKMILSNVKDKFKSEAYERALFTLVNRSVLNESRLNNDIGVDNILSQTIESVDKVKYIETQ